MKFFNRHITFRYFSMLMLTSIFILKPGERKVYAQKAAPQEYQVKAAFLYNFTQFVDWPPNAFRNSDDPFVIGIVGNDPFGPFLKETIAGEKIGTHPIRTKQCNDIKSAAGCHMLFINSTDEEWVRYLLAALSEKNVLTVSDDPRFTRMGGMIRFFTEDNKIRLEINVERSKAAQLNISSKLLSLAKTN